jgi:photosystem II stability/assembly factor-like uncharacterized protein
VTGAGKAALLALGIVGSACGGRAPDIVPELTLQESGVAVRLQAVSAVSETVAWASGLGGTWVRTTDGGVTWTAGVVPGADTLQFRDVHAVSAEVAYLLAAGPGGMSRIYKTADGGATWTLQYTNPDPSGFLDCFDFWDADVGVAFGDAVAGELAILVTRDGASWERVPRDAVPDALDGEGGFAASGTCVVTVGDAAAYIGTGNAAPARVLATTDRGRTWTAVETPAVNGLGRGITSLAFRNAGHGVLAAGEITDPDWHADQIAVTDDGGASWSLAGLPTFPGAIYGVAWVPRAPRPTLVGTGPNGAAYSFDDGRSWVSLDTANWWGLGFASPDAGWLAGPEGRIAKVTWREAGPRP